MTAPQARTEHEVEDAAERTSAIVYGNILVLAGVVAQPAGQAATWPALGAVVGTGVATFLAHHFASTQAHLVRTGAPPTREERRREWRNGLPIVSATILPTLALGLAIAGVLSPQTGWRVAVLTIIVRMALYGYFAARLLQRRPSGRSLVSGVALAVGCLALAVVKDLLTH